MNCKHFDSCSAPLCPLDTESLMQGIWFCDEDICRLRQVPRFVRNQRTIHRRSKDNDTYYSHSMLDRNIVIKTSIAGIDRDQEIKQASLAEKKWIKDHQEKKPLTEEQRKIISDRLNQKGSTRGLTHKKDAHTGAQTPLLG